MILPRREDIYHQIQLYRLLTFLIDDSFASQVIYFKGGTCAAMLGWLDRFSWDLDFDLKRGVSQKAIEGHLKKIFQNLGLLPKKQTREGLLYILKYPSKMGRNSLKLSITDLTVQNNQYQPFYLKDIDRYAICQTKETMFANKLVSLTERYQKYHQIAGRDLYDIHHFLSQGFSYRKEIIEERTGKNYLDYLKELIEFIEEKINEKVICEDLNYLLPPEKFKQIRKVLIPEALMMLKNEADISRQRP